LRPSHTTHTCPALRFWRTTSDRDTPVHTPVMTASPPNAMPNVAAMPPSALAAAAPGFLRSKDIAARRDAQCRGDERQWA
jgi:hypothetical protein